LATWRERRDLDAIADAASSEPVTGLTEVTRIVHIVKRALTVLALAVSVASLGTGCTITRLWQPTDEQVLRRILPSAVQVVLEQPEGRRFRTASGVIIAARPATGGTECFVLTAGHTFAGGARGKAVYVIAGSPEGPGTKVPATVLFDRETEHLDLALLKTEGVDRCSPARVKRPATLGEWAWVVAFPWGSRLTLARGVVSQIDRDGPGDRERARLMVDASVSYGASGAGVYEARTGSLIGVVEGYGTTRVSSQGGGTPWYIDVPMPGQTIVTSIQRIWRFLEESGHADLVGGSSPEGP
jgi:S1-C subfamily serine protease